MRSFRVPPRHRVIQSISRIAVCALPISASVCPMPSTLPVSTSDILLRFTNFHFGYGFSRSPFHAAPESSRQKDRIAITKWVRRTFPEHSFFSGTLFQELGYLGLRNQLLSGAFNWRQRQMITGSFLQHLKESDSLAPVLRNGMSKCIRTHSSNIRLAMAAVLFGTLTLSGWLRNRPPRPRHKIRRRRGLCPMLNYSQPASHFPIR